VGINIVTSLTTETGHGHWCVAHGRICRMLTEREVYGRAFTGCATALHQVLRPSDPYRPFVHVPKFSVGPELSTRRRRLSGLLPTNVCPVSVQSVGAVLEGKRESGVCGRSSCIRSIACSFLRCPWRDDPLRNLKRHWKMTHKLRSRSRAAAVRNIRPGPARELGHLWSFVYRSGGRAHNGRFSSTKSSRRNWTT